MFMNQLELCPFAIHISCIHTCMYTKSLEDIFDNDKIDMEENQKFLNFELLS